jgi:hypothetical protein
MIKLGSELQHKLSISLPPTQANHFASSSSLSCGGAVPIRPFLAGQAFEPEIIEVMSAAFVGACETLGLKIRDDPATRLVARTIIELAQRGLRDSEILLDMTLWEFRTEYDAERSE